MSEVVVNHECDVCYEKFNKTTHKIIPCEYTATCEFVACMTCVRAYLLGTTQIEACCMNCSKAWSPEFLTILTKTWITTTYKKHRERLLLETQMIQMADTMEPATRWKQRQESSCMRAIAISNMHKLNDKKKADDNNLKIEYKDVLKNKTKKSYKDEYAVYLTLKQRIEDDYTLEEKIIRTTRLQATVRLSISLQENDDPREVVHDFLRREWNTVGRQAMDYWNHTNHPGQEKHIQTIIENTEIVLSECKRLKDDDYSTRISNALGFGNVTTGSSDLVEVVRKEKKSFFMQCPANECNGMVSTQYNCGLCKIKVCKDCHEMIKDKEASDHKCDPNNVATAAAIKKDTKQCPGCHIPVFRSEGCSQMWCTSCHTAFDWRTGDKIEGHIHNPHWLEFQRAQNGGVNIRAPGDQHCGGLCTPAELARLLKNKNCTAHTVTLFKNIYTMVDEITRNKLRIARLDSQRVYNYQENRIFYLVGRMTKEDFASILYQNYNKKLFNTGLVLVYELISMVGVEMFHDLIQTVENPDTNFDLVFSTKLKEFTTLARHCNQLSAKLSIAYNKSSIHIFPNFVSHSKKYTIKESRLPQSTN